MSLQLCNLPSELLIQILSHLHPDDLVASQLSSRTLHNIVLSSPFLQYTCALQVSGMIDNPHSPLPLSSRLELLKKRHDAWYNLRHNFASSIPVLGYEDASGIYDLSGGVYFFGNETGHAIHWVRLPSTASEAEKSEWRTLAIWDASVLDSGANIYEWDLLAVVTTRPGTNNPTDIIPNYDIELRLYELSTGNPHPLAKHPIIFITSSHVERPHLAGIEIVGQTLVFVLTFYHSTPTYDDRVYVYDWVEGDVKMEIPRPVYTYSHVIMLREDLFVLPNAINGTLEYWVIPPCSSPNEPAFTLSLPPLLPSQRIRNIGCRAYPNPTSSSSLRYNINNKRLFKPIHPDPQKSIVIINLHTTPNDVFPLRQMNEMAYNIFVARGDLVRLFDQHLSSSSPSTSPSPVAWSAWGPPITRWMFIRPHWITTTAGQKVVMSYGTERQRDEQQRKSCFCVLDFNPFEVQREINRQRWQESDAYVDNPDAAPFPNDYVYTQARFFHQARANRTLITNIETVSPLPYMAAMDFEEAFGETFSCSLPYIMTKTEEMECDSGFMIDEERILGIDIDDEGEMSTSLLHYG